MKGCCNRLMILWRNDTKFVPFCFLLLMKMSLVVVITSLWGIIQFIPQSQFGLKRYFLTCWFEWCNVILQNPGRDAWLCNQGIMIFCSDCSICLKMCIILSIRVLIFVVMITSKYACLYKSLCMLHISITFYFCVCDMLISEVKCDQNKKNKNLRDLIGAPGLVISLKLYSNRECDLEIWWMTSKNNRTHLLYYIRLCPSLNTLQWMNSNLSYSLETSIRVKSGDFLFRVTSKFDGWPWNTIGHLFYTTSSFMHHLKVVGLLKVTVRRFLSPATLKFDGWPRKTIANLFYVASSFVYHFVSIGKFKLEL